MTRYLNWVVKSAIMTPMAKYILITRIVFHRTVYIICSHFSGLVSHSLLRVIINCVCKLSTYTCVTVCIKIVVCLYKL